jgi:hypothetical protein
VNLVLTRFRFYLSVSALFVGCLVGVLLISYLIGHFVPIAWLRGTLDILVMALGVVAFESLTGGHTSYRKYVVSRSGVLTSPSRFWATTGQAIVVVVAVTLIGAVSYVAANSPQDSVWRPIAMLAWPVVPGATAVYLLIARDWRRELASSTNAA